MKRPSILATRCTFGNVAELTLPQQITHIDGVRFNLMGRVLDIMSREDGDLIVLVDRGNEWATGRICAEAVRSAKARGDTLTEWWHGTYHQTMNEACEAMRQRAAGRSASEVDVTQDMI